MNFAKNIGALLVLIFAVGCLTTSQPAAKEPAYQGRELTQWLRDFDDPETQAMAAEAVRHIGTAALPFLEAQLSREKDQGFRIEMKKWREKQVPATYSVPRPPNPRFEALAGLDALGSAALPALPVLEKILREEEPADLRVLYVVARMGPAGVPILNQMRTNEVKILRMGAGICLDMIASHSETLYPAVPVGPDAPSLDRRICELNLKMLQAAVQVYQAEHPESSVPGQDVTTPPPVLPQ